MFFPQKILPNLFQTIITKKQEKIKGRFISILYYSSHSVKDNYYHINNLILSCSFLTEVIFVVIVLLDLFHIFFIQFSSGLPVATLVFGSLTVCTRSSFFKNKWRESYHMFLQRHSYLPDSNKTASMMMKKDRPPKRMCRHSSIIP